MSRRSKSKKHIPSVRPEKTTVETIRDLRKRKRRRQILIVSGIIVVLTAAISAAIILSMPQPSGTLPGTLVVHIYDAAAYQPPCPNPLPTLVANETVILRGTKASSANATVGLIAFQGFPPGNYTVTAKAAGYQQSNQTATLVSGTTTHVCLALTKNP